MKSQSINQYTGYLASGFRFRFHVRSISHRCLFLPLVMEKLPRIRRLLEGESPLTVFNCRCISSARKAFCELRKKFDFAYWAITEYYIRDLNDADNIIPLRLNTPQHYLIDILQKRYHNHLPGRYVVTKTGFPCGITTCIRAYITWMQTFQCRNNSYMCSSSDINLNPHKTDLCRWLKREIVPSEKWLYLPDADRRAFFNTYRSPDFIRGINLGYVHFADMSKWKDPRGDLTQRVMKAAVSAVLLEYFTLVIYEGNIPDETHFNIKAYQDFRISREERLKQLAHLSSNPGFLNYVALADAPDDSSPILHIDLSDTCPPPAEHA
ncbi:MAG: hypothetical protein K2N09_00495 [Muribaculaceae bacterium]|nr:hypothetical protein [Muribaculaceae bacterium]